MKHFKFLKKQVLLFLTDFLNGGYSIGNVGIFVEGQKDLDCFVFVLFLGLGSRRVSYSMGLLVYFSGGSLLQIKQNLGVGVLDFFRANKLRFTTQSNQAYTNYNSFLLEISTNGSIVVEPLVTKLTDQRILCKVIVQGQTSFETPSDQF